MTESLVSIVEVAPSEWERAREIRLRALAECPDAFGSTLEHERQLSDLDWERRCGRSDVITFVAVASGEADVGLVVGAPYDEWAGLYSMWTEPSWRKRGVGGWLVDAVIAWTRSQGRKRLLLDVGDWNLPAIALYRSRGFVPTGQVGTLPPPRTHITEQQLALRL